MNLPSPYLKKKQIVTLISFCLYTPACGCHHHRCHCGRHRRHRRRHSIIQLITFFSIRPALIYWEFRERKSTLVWLIKFYIEYIYSLNMDSTISAFIIKTSINSMSWPAFQVHLIRSPHNFAIPPWKVYWWSWGDGCSYMPCQYLFNTISEITRTIWS